ncbi:hypothetical protein ACS0TY_009378 [Phlomoides rotata]
MAEKPNRDPNASASADNYHVETVNSGRQVWLMKCPPVVAQAMQNANRQTLPLDAPAGPIVAKVILTVDPQGSSSNQYVMELANTGDRNMPKRFSMDMSTDVLPMAVLSESSQGRHSVEGKINFKFDMKPHKEHIADYSKLCRERTNKYMTRTRQIQVIDNDNGMCMRPMPGTFDMKSSGSTEKKVQGKGIETKRTRRAPDEMEKIMFKLFERQPNWTLKQLIQTTDQPEQFLKDMLKSLCVYNNKGANQGSYELKPEYRRLSAFI